MKTFTIVCAAIASLAMAVREEGETYFQAPAAEAPPAPPTAEAPPAPPASEAPPAPPAQVIESFDGWDGYYNLSYDEFENALMTDDENVWIVAFITPTCGMC